MASRWTLSKGKPLLKSCLIKIPDSPSQLPAVKSLHHSRENIRSTFDRPAGAHFRPHFGQSDLRLRTGLLRFEQPPDLGFDGCGREGILNEFDRDLAARD